jgi:hypothetical protein
MSEGVILGWALVTLGVIALLFGGAIRLRIKGSSVEDETPDIDYSPHDRPEGPLSLEERTKRAFQAKVAWEFIAPALEALRDEYRQAQMRAAINEPDKPAKIINLSVAQRVINTVEAHMQAAIKDGDVAANEKARAEQVARMSPAKRKYLNFAPN